MDSLYGTADASLPFIPELSVERRRALQVESAALAGLAPFFSDDLACGGSGPELAVIPAGVFEMGSPGNEFGHRADEGPLHYRPVRTAFAIGTHPVTAEAFSLFERATGWRWRSDLITSSGRHPVINLRHGEAEDYCAWLSEQTGARYRLPGEAEWEYACRAGSRTPFHLGEHITCRDVHFKAAFPYQEARQKQRWYLPKCSPVPSTVPVGLYRPNDWGLYDMHGNIWEMTADNWAASYARRPAFTRERGSRRGKRIAVRGGSWFDPAVAARSASRRPRLRDELDVNLGFRVLREL